MRASIDVHTYIQTDRPTDRPTDRQTDQQTYRHTDIQTYIHTYIHTYIQYTYIEQEPVLGEPHTWREASFVILCFHMEFGLQPDAKARHC